MSANTPQWKSNRLAPRAIEVLELHKHKQPAIAAYEETLVPAAHLVMDLYGKLQAYDGTRAAEHTEGKEAVAALLQKSRGWAGLVQRRLDGFDPSSVGSRAEVAEDVISDARKLLAVVRGRIEEGMAEPSFFAAMVADLEPAIALAKNESSGAAAAHSTHQELQAAVREACDLFNAELIAFRRTLATFLGKSHRDYQRLRASRISRLEDDAAASPDPHVEEGTEEVEAAE